MIKIIGTYAGETVLKNESLPLKTIAKGIGLKETDDGSRFNMSQTGEMKAARKTIGTDHRENRTIDKK